MDEKGDEQKKEKHPVILRSAAGAPQHTTWYDSTGNKIRICERPNGLKKDQHEPANRTRNPLLRQRSQNCPSTKLLPLPIIDVRAPVLTVLLTDCLCSTMQHQRRNGGSVRGGRSREKCSSRDDATRKNRAAGRDPALQQEAPHPEWNASDWKRWDESHGNMLWMGALQASDMSFARRPCVGLRGLRIFAYVAAARSLPEELSTRTLTLLLSAGLLRPLIRWLRIASLLYLYTQRVYSPLLRSRTSPP